MNTHSRARLTFARRVELVHRVRFAAWPEGQAASAAEVTTRTARKWLRRFDEGGVEALKDRSSRPNCMPRLTCAERTQLILQLRACRMSGPAIANALAMPRSTVAAVLRRAGQSRLPPLQPPPPVLRYERDHPGDLLHIDIKKLGRIERIGHRITGDRRDTSRGAGWEYAHVAIDDCSRVAYVEVLPDECKANAIGFLTRAIRFYGRHGVRVGELLSDNGSAYKSRDFAQACSKLGLRHLRTRPYTPRTNGKAERLVQTLMREWAYVIPYASSAQRTRALASWSAYYNRSRPHGGLNGMTPMSRLHLARRNNVSGNHS